MFDYVVSFIYLDKYHRTAECDSAYSLIQNMFYWRAVTFSSAVIMSWS